MTDSKTNAVHETMKRDEEIQGSSDRSFGFVFSFVFVAVGLWPLLSGGGPRIWGLVIAGFFLVLALASPSILAPLNRQWTRFGLLLHKITNPIIMGLVFFAGRVLYRKAYIADPGTRTTGMMMGFLANIVLLICATLSVIF